MTRTAFNRRYDFIGFLASPNAPRWLPVATPVPELKEPRKRVKDPAIRPSHLKARRYWPTCPLLRISRQLPIKLPPVIPRQRPPGIGDNGPRGTSRPVPQVPDSGQGPACPGKPARHAQGAVSCHPPQRHPAARKRLKGQVGPLRKKFRSDLFGLALTPPTRRNDWVKEPDPIRPNHLAHKRQTRVNPLTRIAEQLPRKLPVISAHWDHQIPVERTKS